MQQTTYNKQHAKCNMQQHLPNLYRNTFRYTITLLIPEDGLISRSRLVIYRYINLLLAQKK